ncbi:hypothetical protein [Burkholderia sp. LMG 13014]|uniref:hypothetical protein n=1 Tax=Burkholderia sp. LMG 13014 TaxID=2709306 RepID=UPI0019668A69|nr:hypothetical protein [Burkholderia sp. LMG 13014]
MNYLASLPPKKRFYAALVCLPLMYFICKGTTVGLTWAMGESVPAVLLVGFLCIAAALKMQHIAAAVVSLFCRGQ